MDLASIDWISIAFIAILSICALVGFVRGGARDLLKLIVQAAAVGLAMLTCKLIGNILYGITPLHDVLFNPIRSFLEPIFGEYASQMVTEADLTEGVRYGFYDSMKVPAFLTAPYDAAVVDRIPQGEFELIFPFTDALVSLLLTGIGFLVIYLLVLLIGSLILGAIFKANKNGEKKKPGIVSRFLGIIVGAARGAVILWAVSLVLHIFFLMDLSFSSFLMDMVGYNDPNSASFAKWFMTLPLGYDQILAFFIH